MPLRSPLDRVPEQEIPSSHGGGQDRPDIRSDFVLEQLEKVKVSSQFRSSRRCVIFLNYVVQLAVRGQHEPLKERTVGVEVFGRDPDYDTNQDPIVRGTASEIRKRLAQYYHSPGHENELRIELPAGSYLPEFHWPAAHSQPLALTAEQQKEASTVARQAARRPARLIRGWVQVLAALAVLGLLATIGLLFNRANDGHRISTGSALDQFWAPVLSSPGTVLLCVGQPLVFNVFGELGKAVNKAPTVNGRKRGRLSGDMSELVPSPDRYLALGDAICLTDMVALLTKKNRDYHIRGGTVTSFADLRESPAILIGAFTNEWAMRLAGSLRYTFATSPDLLSHYVRDNMHPADRNWQLKNIWPDWQMPLDYAIVSRVVDRTTDKVVVMAAGITHYGTAAAGEFLVNPDYLAQAFDKLPAGWQNKNIQVVLSTKVIGGTAGPPQVVALHVQ